MRRVAVFLAAVLLLFSLLMVGSSAFACWRGAQIYARAAAIFGAERLYADLPALTTSKDEVQLLQPEHEWEHGETEGTEPNTEKRGEDKTGASLDGADDVPEITVGASSLKSAAALETTPVEKPDLAALRKVNAAVQGWLWIPGSTISYPLMQGENNDYYLEHTWDGAPGAVGSIFLEAACAADLSDFNTIIYGHHMQSGAMFAPLLNYRRQDYLEKHRKICIWNDSGLFVYRVFAAFEAERAGFVYQTEPSGEEEKRVYLEKSVAASCVSCDLLPEEIGSHILTLSTCTGRGYDTRWVVQAALVNAPEQE